MKKVSVEHVTFTLCDDEEKEIATYEHKLNEMSLDESDIGWQFNVKLIQSNITLTILLH